MALPLQELLERYSRLRLAVEMANDKQVRFWWLLGGGKGERWPPLSAGSM